MGGSSWVRCIAVLLLTCLRPHSSCQTELRTSSGIFYIVLFLGVDLSIFVQQTTYCSFPFGDFFPLYFLRQNFYQEKLATELSPEALLSLRSRHQGVSIHSFSVILRSQEHVSHSHLWPHLSGSGPAGSSFITECVAGYWLMQLSH